VQAHQFALSTSHRHLPVIAEAHQSPKALTTIRDTEQQRAFDWYHPTRKNYIRAVAEAAIRRIPQNTARVQGLRSIMRDYAEIVLRRKDRFALNDYMTRRLKEAIPTEERLEWNTRTEPWSKEALSEVIERLKSLMTAIIKEFEQLILHLLHKGRNLKRELPRNRVAVRIRLTEGSRAKCAIIAEHAEDGLYIVDLQPMAAYDRCSRRRMKRDRGRSRKRPNEWSRPSAYAA
jgi:hypothetical protein